MIKRLLSFIFLAAVCLNSVAQDITVTGFGMRNDVVQIYYNADIAKGIKLTNFRVYANINGTNHQLSNLSGDIGVIKTSGDKVITWDCFKDLAVNDISGNIFFTIDCTPIGVNNRFENANAFNMYLEYCYTPSAPFTFGMGMGGRFGAYYRIGVSDSKSRGYGYKSTNTMWSVGMYVIALRWLNFNVGYNQLHLSDRTCPGYELGATVLFTRKKWFGVNVGYIGSFENSRYGEFYVGLTFNWNTGV